MVGLKNCMSFFYLKWIRVKSKVGLTIYRHVKVSQPGSYGLAHHEPGSK